MRLRWRQGAGPAHVVLRASVPGARWDRPGNESAAVQVWLDGAFHQDVVLVHGEEEAAYERLLGELPAGPHEVEVRPHPLAPPRSSARLTDLAAGPVDPRDEGEALAWRHAPWIFTRAESDPWESLWTDTPLLLFYRLATDVLEYQCVFSNEDGGTDTRGLLAQWGRTTDIEWVLRVDRCGGPTTIQGRHHRTEVHRETSLLGRRTLQVVGLHGMVGSEPPSGAMRSLFLPRFRWDDADPREAVMDAHPWTYRLAALEMAREGKLRPETAADDPTPGDLRDYLYAQVLRADKGAPQTGIEIRAHLADGRIFSSTHGDPRQACRRPCPFSTTVKLPRGASPVAIDAVACPAPGAGAVRLQLHKAFHLGTDFLPLPPFAAGPPVAITAAAPAVRLWPGGG